MGGIVDHAVIGNVTLYLGDMREVLPELGRLRADTVVSDPPYPLTSGGNATEVMGGLFSQDVYDNSGDLMPSVPWHHMGGPIFRACADDADCYIMANDKNVWAAHAAFTGAGFAFHNLLVWDKIRATRNRWYMKNCEFTLYLFKGLAAPQGIADCGSKQLFTLNAARTSGHKTEKPIALMQHYIANSCPPGGLVLDPFAGSGSTLLAAAALGRRAVGIELEREWFDVACARLESALCAGAELGYGSV